MTRSTGFDFRVWLIVVFIYNKYISSLFRSVFLLNFNTYVRWYFRSIKEMCNYSWWLLNYNQMMSVWKVEMISNLSYIKGRNLSEYKNVSYHSWILLKRYKNDIVRDKENELTNFSFVDKTKWCEDTSELVALLDWLKSRNMWCIWQYLEYRDMKFKFSRIDKTTNHMNDRFKITPKSLIFSCEIRMFTKIC